MILVALAMAHLGYFGPAAKGMKRAGSALGTLRAANEKVGERSMWRGTGASDERKMPSRDIEGR
jgi:hypothetical protein